MSGGSAASARTGSIAPIESRRIWTYRSPSARGAQGGGCKMVVVQIRKQHREHARIGTGQACASEHQSDVVMKRIGRDPVPEQLHGRSLAIGGIDARTPQFEDFAGMGDERSDVVFVSRIETAKPSSRFPPEQPIGSDN